MNSSIELLNTALTQQPGEAVQSVRLAIHELIKALEAARVSGNTDDDTKTA